MIKKGSIFTILSLIVLYSFAQHCPWDGSSLIMLDFKNNPAVTVKKIYLLDSADNKVTSKRYYENKVKEDTAVFWKNTIDIAKKNPSRFDKHYYPFAKNKEVLVFGQYHSNMKYSILILYLSGNKAKQMKIALSNKDIYMLCTLNKNLWDGKEKPVELTL